MPRKRLPSSQRKSSGELSKKKEFSNWMAKKLKVFKFAGLTLSGGKTDKSCLAILEYYPNQKKIFLSHLENKISSEVNESADIKIVKTISNLSKELEYLAYDAPLKLPKCMRCRLKCPGYEVCNEPEIKWLRNSYSKKNEKKRPSKSFTPYTERCAENFIANELEEKFHPQHSLGANLAPLTARALFLSRQIKVSSLEVYPKLSLWRIGRSLGIQKSYLRSHKHSVDGAEVREIILENLIEKDIAFLYEQDVKIMIDDNHAFEAFLCALTAVLKHQNQVEKKPKGYPRSEAWVEIPKQKIEWT